MKTEDTRDGTRCRGTCLSADPLLIWTHSLSTTIHVSRFQYGTECVCELSSLGGRSRLKADQQLNMSIDIEE